MNIDLPKLQDHSKFRNFINKKQFASLTTSKQSEILPPNILPLDDVSLNRTASLITMSPFSPIVDLKRPFNVKTTPNSPFGDGLKFLTPIKESPEENTLDGGTKMAQNKSTPKTEPTSCKTQ